MKKILTLIFYMLLIILPLRAAAYDYMVEFVAEKYKEMAIGEGAAYKVYHTLQVNSELGSRLLLLTGDDFEYRIWLREYLARNNRLILKIPDDADGLFRVSKLFELDVNAVHPVTGEKWAEKVLLSPGAPIIEPLFSGKKHILIIDDNPEKRDLIEMIVKDLGFPVTPSGNQFDALRAFKHQPDKFKMVIVDSIMAGSSSTGLVKSLVDTAPDIPVILGTEYKDQKTTALMKDFFSGYGRVIVKPVVLRELSKTILDILNQKA